MSTNTDGLETMSSGISVYVEDKTTKTTAMPRSEKEELEMDAPKWDLQRDVQGYPPAVQKLGLNFHRPQTQMFPGPKRFTWNQQIRLHLKARYLQ